MNKTSLVRGKSRLQLPKNSKKHGFMECIAEQIEPYYRQAGAAQFSKDAKLPLEFQQARRK
jgi:hypothetical protein